MFDPSSEIANGAAWMELRAQGETGTSEDRDRAARMAAWLQYWLARGAHDLDPSIVAFIAPCAAREQAALAGKTEAGEQTG